MFLCICRFCCFILFSALRIYRKPVLFCMSLSVCLSVTQSFWFMVIASLRLHFQHFCCEKTSPYIAAKRNRQTKKTQCVPIIYNGRYRSGYTACHPFHSKVPILLFLHVNSKTEQQRWHVVEFWKQILTVFNASPRTALLDRASNVLWLCWLCLIPVLVSCSIFNFVFRIKIHLVSMLICISNSTVFLSVLCLRFRPTICIK